MLLKPKSNLPLIKGLMLSCSLFLWAFSAIWLYTQYNDQKERLVQDLAFKSSELTQLFREQGISGPARRDRAAAGRHHRVRADSDAVSEHRKIVLNLSGYGIDTSTFQKLMTALPVTFLGEFDYEWSDSAPAHSNAIIMRGLLPDSAKNLLITGYKFYLFKKILPQLFFVVVFMVVVAIAFRLSFITIRRQVQLSVIKNDFVSNMSHELRTPVATVKLALETIGNKNMSRDLSRQREYLDMANREIDRLELLIDQVMQVAFTEQGKIVLQRKIEDAAWLTEDVLRSMKLRFAQNEATVQVRYAGSDFRVPMDRIHIQGVLFNILDNSLKYAGDNTHVHITVKEQPNHVEWMISDNGPGIPDEFRERIFEKFFRVPAGDQHDVKGYGLGLTYASQMIQKHEGEIFVVNNKDKGCTFVVTVKR